MKKKKFLLKNLLNFNENIQTRLKILKFNKKKWSRFKTILLLEKKINNSIFKDLTSYKLNKKQNLLFDQTIYHTPSFYNKSTKNFTRSQFKAKKKLIFFFGELKKNYLKKIIKKNNNISKHNTPTCAILKIFESRLDFILYKAGFGFNVLETKKLIISGHVFLNNKKINNPAYQIKKGDHIKIKLNYLNPLKKKLFQLKPTIKNSLTPNYAQINFKTLEIIIIKDLNFSTTISNFYFYLNLNEIMHNYR